MEHLHSLLNVPTALGTRDTKNTKDTEDTKNMFAAAHGRWRQHLHSNSFVFLVFFVFGVLAVLAANFL